MAGKKMTKEREINILIVLISVFVIISLLVLSFQIKNKTDNLTNSSYNARKEDLQLKQTALGQAIIDLNNTLQQEKARQQALANEIASMNNQSPSASNPSPSAPPAPAPTPTPPPVTRAS
jgi:predicted PurR-regulated permease PerM